jgi:hypothetical protein
MTDGLYNAASSPDGHGKSGGAGSQIWRPQGLIRRIYGVGARHNNAHGSASRSALQSTLRQPCLGRCVIGGGRRRRGQGQRGGVCFPVLHMWWWWWRRALCGGCVLAAATMWVWWRSCGGRNRLELPASEPWCGSGGLEPLLAAARNFGVLSLPWRWCCRAGGSDVGLVVVPVEVAAACREVAACSLRQGGGSGRGVAVA